MVCGAIRSSPQAPDGHMETMDLVVSSPGGYGNRRAAPHVEVLSLADALETCLPLEQGFKGHKMCQGWDEFKKTGQVSKEGMQQNFCIMHTLLGFNHLGIFKKQQLKDSLMVLDRKLKNKLSLVAPVIWAEEEATLIHANLMALRKLFRNCKNMTRTPAWLKSLFDQLAKVNLEGVESEESQGNQTPMSGSSSSGSLDIHLGNKLFDQSHLPSMKRNRPLVYRKSQSPSKSMLDKFIKPTGEQQVQLMMMMMMMVMVMMMMMMMVMMMMIMMMMMIRATRTRLPTTMTRC